MLWHHFIVKLFFKNKIIFKISTHNKRYSSQLTFWQLTDTDHLLLFKRKMISYYIDYQVKNVFKICLRLISFPISFTMCLMCLIWAITSSTQERQKQLPWWLPWHTYAWKEPWCTNKNTSRSPSWPSFRLSFSLKSKLRCSLSSKDNWDVKTCCSDKV